MASSLKLFFLLFTLISSLCLRPADSIEFEVGDAAGWAIPPHNDTDMYNDWAAKNRFKVGDTINFKYNKDSVMVVSEGDYDKCISTHPTFFSNNGNTMFAFNQSGDYYFISGISGHCQRGQKMIIKVLGHSVPSTSPPAGGNGTRPINPPSPSGAATARGGGASFMVVVVLQLVVVFVGSLFY